MYHEGKYYLYCTGDTEASYDAYSAHKGWQTNKGERDGIEVHVSSDMQRWTNLGYCLEKDQNVVGSSMFWAPEVYNHNGKFYMAYTADEHCCIAVSDKPDGPFVKINDSYLVKEPSIDPHLFFDDDGKIYLYHVRFRPGNSIFVAEMKPDLSDIEKEYDEILIKAEAPWETLKGHIAEDPFVLKHNGLYYLSYSCNDVTCEKYAVGYAVSKSPLGPYEKYEGNPILIGNDKVWGCGQHSFVYDEDGDLICVYHCHNPYGEKLAPRRICFKRAGFVKRDNGEDVLTVFED